MHISVVCPRRPAQPPRGIPGLRPQAPFPRRWLTPAADPVTAAETAQAGERVPSLGNSFRVRLASYRKPANATKGWKILSNKHEDLLAPLNHAVAEVDLGAEKGIYHRLEAGPLGSLAEAKELCD